MQAIIDQMVHRDVGSSSISIPLIEVFYFDNGNAFLFPFFTSPSFFSLLFLDFLYTYLVSPPFLLLFQLLPLLVTFSFVFHSRPPFIRPYFFPSCRVFACVFLSFLPLTLLSLFCGLVSCPLPWLPSLCVVASRILDIMLFSNLPLFKRKANLN